MAEKHIPERMCSGCRERRQKGELVRVVRSPDGVISLDTTGKAPGRGAYICRNAECLKKARKNRSIERSFKCKISDEVYGELEKELVAT